MAAQPTNMVEQQLHETHSESEYLSSDESLHHDASDDSDDGNEDDIILAEDLDHLNPADYTKSYNRQRRLADPAVPEAEKPKTNPQQRPAESAKSRLRVSDQLASLSHLQDVLSHTHVNSNRDRADRATTDNVLDPKTRLILLQMQQRGVYENIHGCVSTGKEANVYQATRTQDVATAVASAELVPAGIKNLAVKVYKTAILHFKDRQRYIQGEHRFRRYRKGAGGPSSSRHMVKLWAEKEFRNLKRLHGAGLPVPQPLYLKQNVLVMKFLGNSKGYAYPRLKDVTIRAEDGRDVDQEWSDIYRLVLAYMRVMFQTCNLVHGDLSEFNMLFDPLKHKLFVIDVSQSVEKAHPRSLEFLRMDIKNVRDFFNRKAILTLSERETYNFITDNKAMENTDQLIEEVKALEQKRMESSAEEREVMEKEDEVFRERYIPRTLEEVADGDELADKMDIQDLLAPRTSGDADAGASVSEPESEGSESASEEENFDFDDDKAPRGHRFEGKEDKKARKAAVKEAQRDKRTKKMKKHVKKAIVASTARPKRH